MSVRFRLYGCERMRRQRLIGECIVSFSNMNLQLHSNIWVPLEPRANTAVSIIYFFIRIIILLTVFIYKGSFIL